MAGGGINVRVAKSGAGDSDAKKQAKDVLAALSQEPEDAWFEGTGSLKPPYDPEILLEVFEDSNILSQNVAAYATNIDGFGYTLEPVIDLDSDDGRAVVRADLARSSKGPVSDDQVKAKIQEYKAEADAERVRLRRFLEYCTLGMSFTTLRKRKRQDEESTGNGFWEVVRDGDGQIAKLVLVPSYMVRLRPLLPQPVEVKERQRVGPFKFENVSVMRRFRTYVQRLDMGGGVIPGSGETMHAVYFKEFGDPRTVSAKTGNVYKDLDHMRTAEEDAVPANEMIHFRIFCSSSPYGVPRWIGNLRSVLGSIEMETVNVSYFKNKAVPPMAILVSGGVVTDEAVARIEQKIQQEVKGTDNWHSILIIEATAQEGSNVAPKVDMKPLMESILKDQVFGSYDERNVDKASSSFRVPRLLRGDVRDFNRATAYASIRFAEEQVFSGEREEFDFTFNRLILSDMGIKYWRFVSQGPKIRDPETIINLAVDAAKAAAITPNEVRSIMSRALGIDLPRIEEEWATRPPSFTLAARGYLPGEEGAPVTGQQVEGLMEEAKSISKRIAQAIAKVEAGVEDEDTRAFQAEIARMSGLDQGTFQDATSGDKGSGPADPDGDAGAGGGAEGE